MKKGKLQQLGVPAGYRLTNDNKDLVIKAAVKKKFGKKIEALLNREVEVMNCITEWRTPSREALLRFQAEFESFTGTTRETFIDTNRSFNVYFSKALETKHKLESLYSAGLRGEHMELGYDYCDYSVLGSIVTIVEPSTKLIDEYYTQSICFSGNRVEAEDLPKPLLDMVIKFYKDAYKTVVAVRELQHKMRQVLSKYTSALKLCTDVDGMAGIIRLSLDMEEEYRCSDIPDKDNIVQLQKLL